ncbi:MAG: Histidinol dehydrogenase [Actinomycetota bacterium]|jgi:histidinol dehydrogenase
MMRVLDLRGQQPDRSEMLALIPRHVGDSQSAHAAARDLVDQVRDGGEGALRAHAERFDRVSEHSIRVPREHFTQALESLSPEIRQALESAIERVRKATTAQLPTDAITEFGDGARVIQRWLPVERVGLYVPGGKAVYPSSVVMNVVPAQVAGVTSIALVSPPQEAFGGRIHPTILAAAELLGISEVYAMGGAGAIGALAFGVPELELAPVSVITGPGNQYVAAAKRYVRSHVGIDSEAGPTEILIIADSSADPRFVAADLISQAEHDELASAVLVTDSPELVDAVSRELVSQVDQTMHAERVGVALGGSQSALVVVDSLDVAVDFSNAYGPEHLEVQTSRNDALLPRLVNAGAIFLGPYSPVSLGDYSAGSNHVLPTGGHSAFSSGLGAYTFLRAQQVVDYSADALRRVSAGLQALATNEALPAHGEAVAIRFDEQS